MAAYQTRDTVTKTVSLMLWDMDRQENGHVNLRIGCLLDKTPIHVINYPP